MISLLFAYTTTPSACEDSSKETASSPSSTSLSPEETYQQARRYLKGEGVAKDPQRAYELMKQAAEGGYAEALGGIGYFYATGIVVPKDERSAMEWFRKGAEMGGPRAQLNLGKYLLNGTGGEPVNVQAGLEWVHKAAAQGLPEANFFLGHVFYFGEYGQTVNYDEAFSYLREEAERGNAEAQNMVGMTVENGWAQQTRDIARAIDWYRKAAEQNLAPAQANLGRMLGPESGRKETRIEALMWLYIAEAQGEVVAQKILQEVQLGLDPNETIEAKRRAAAFRRTRPLQSPVGKEIGEPVRPPGN